LIVQVDYKPLTPYGQDLARNIAIISDAGVLEKEYSLIETAIKLVKDDQRAAKIEFHLKKIPLLNPLDGNNFDPADLFLIKKFIINYVAIIRELDDGTAKAFNMGFSSKKLLDSLCIDQDDADTFYLNDSYSDELKTVRKKIRKIDEELDSIKQKQLLEIQRKFKLDFKLRDFLVVDENIAVKLDKDHFFIEHFDSNNFVVKPIYNKKYFELYLERDGLVAEEQRQEKIIIEKLSKEVRAESKNIAGYIDVVTKLDALIAKARLAVKYNMTRPVIRSQVGNIKIQNGRYIPLVNKCSVLGTKYSPLSTEFNSKVIVIHGSNMGGKTVLLQTVCFLQTLAQTGFFVPADLYETVVFDNIHYIGESMAEEVNGLSSFGLEVHEFMKAYGNLKGKTLFIIDEFARTTNSKEAVALISAVLKAASENSDIYMFMSTHFLELPEFKGVSFYKMKGLNYSEYEKYYLKEKDYGLDERIRLINKYMKYEVMPDEKGAEQYDALNVANILGMDKKILSYAKKYLDVGNE